MTAEIYEKLFREKAKIVGFSEVDIIKCLSYAIPLVNKQLPVIYNTSNLCAFVGYNKKYLKKAALYTNSYYRQFKIKKKNGKSRTLKEPLPSLKEIQIWVLENILYKIPVSKFAKAYIPKRNILDNVRFHKHKNFVVGLDIVNFFSAIKRTAIEEIFMNCGYSSNVSNLLSKLCTCDDVLPQGASTSPYLSNLFLNDFDIALGMYCVSRDIRYTRYADDLTFSGDTLNIEFLIDFVICELKKKSLQLNLDKIKIMKSNQRQIVTGILLNKVIQIPIHQRKEIRKEVYFIRKFGLNSHLLKIENNKANYLSHLVGKIIYALQINPKDNEMQECKKFITQLIDQKT